MKTIKVNCEFASELVCVIPYVYWLHQNNQLEKVITSKGMPPFYYFCDNVEERFEFRHFDINTNGLREVPNDWIHHSVGQAYSTFSEEEQVEANGVLDYSQWTPPPYKDYYQTDEFNHLKPYIVVNNNYNIEYGKPISESLRFFDIKTLYDIFNYLTNSGYIVIYKRPNNTEFAPDNNEIETLNRNITLTAKVEGQGIITDYELCEYYNDVINMNKMKEEYSQYTYNDFQLKLFSSADGFVTTNGGGGILCSYFKKPVVMYVPHGKELRKNYITNRNSYLNKLSGDNIYSVLDPGEINDYSKVIKKVKEVFRGDNK